MSCLQDSDPSYSTSVAQGVGILTVIDGHGKLTAKRMNHHANVSRLLIMTERQLNTNREIVIGRSVQKWYTANMLRCLRF